MGKPRSKNTKRGLTTVCVMIPSELWKRLKLKSIRDRLTVRAVAGALFLAYVEGEFEYEEKKSDPEKKG
jgi:hypothetical protein